MIEMLLSLLREENISEYLIRDISEESLELFFVKKQTDMKRSSLSRSLSVTLYRTHNEADTEYKGSSKVLIFESMEKEQIREKLRSAYTAASYVNDTPYPLPKAVTSDSDSVSVSLSEMARGYSRALYLHDTHTDAFINSAELFCICRHIHTLGSQGTDIRYSECECSGEIVVQCKGKEDVELFDYFRYGTNEYDALAQRVYKRLCEVRDRAQASRSLPSGEYDIILEGECTRELVGYPLWQANAKNIHTGYSSASVGAPLGAALPDITAQPATPFSAEGVKLKEIPLVRDGVLCSVVGNVRFCSYLGIEPTGEYERLAADCGGKHSKPLSELCREKHLYLVSFSDFQFDPLDGYFGGEVRLGYYYDGEKRIPVTGFSISGNYRAACSEFEFSCEGYRDYTYRGPLCIKIKNVSVSGV